MTLGRLTGNQSETLVQLVVLEQTNGSRFPTIEQLAEALGIGYEAARGRLRRLRELGYVVVASPSRYALSPHLCTESESACFLLLAHELAAADPRGKLGKSALRREWETRSEELKIAAAATAILRACIEHGYLKKIVSDETSLRPDERLLHEVDYLRLRARSNGLA